MGKEIWRGRVRRYEEGGGEGGEGGGGGKNCFN